MTVRTSPEFIELQAAVAGRFSIEREIGRGGMGVVFLARDVRLERLVAIKLLAPSLAARPEMRRRFLREARVAANCFHPHIVPIHAVEESGNLAWFVMSYVRGETLAQRVSRSGAQPVELVERIAREMAWALAYAHERGVVHRDIKPENILLEQGTDRSLLSDFGIALVEDIERTPSTGEVAGTASYMAPEQALGETVDGRADLYALGVTLYVAATGRHPFSGASHMAMIVQHATSSAAPVRSVSASIPTVLADAIDRCMAKRPQDRFASAAEFVAALDASTTSVPLSREALQVQSSARGTESLLGWGAAVLVSMTFFYLGEAPGFGRNITAGLGTSIALLLAGTSALRLAETLVGARRALRGGANADDIVRAIEGEPDDATDARRRIALPAASVLSGILLALAEGRISDWTNALPDPLSTLIQLATLVIPPFLIGRGVYQLFSNSPTSRWLRTRIMRPLGRGVVRLFGGTPHEHDQADAGLSAAPTEVLLDNAAHSLFNALPAQVRTGLSSLPKAIESLARDAELLRAADRALDDAERAARAAEPDANVDRLVAMARQREVVQQRLSATIAALEAIRLDLMRLATGAIDASSLTTHLQVARDLEHRVAANAEIQALLAPRFTAGATT